VDIVEGGACQDGLGRGVVVVMVVVVVEGVSVWMGG
jgi:hypothetical protein